MRTLGWIFLLLLALGLVTGGLYGYFHYTGLVVARDTNQARVKELESEIERSAQARGELERRVSGTQQELKANQSELEELRRRRAEAEERLRLVSELTAKLKKMIDTGKLGVVMRGDRMIVQMPAAVLFESGSAELSNDGKATLREVATVLRSDPDRKLIVAGHTDNQPIVDADFRNNWELSAARAVIVTEVLVASGIRPRNLVAAGYGEWHPVGDNRTPQGRAANRRIELVIQPPELEWLPQLVEGVASASASAAGAVAPPPSPSR